ncbi:HlyD family efflux transporter periplasmic adaptor subunit [Sphingobacterium multivorum]|uniref:HlyD family efflux transporter periplasmic adaptor subunit n=1 Tax=Sphingobacterium multivorum TaxID=28454 RepID=UPI0028A0762E|nr:HlyD family efflux transporter periplasmic adaptor subunit [Sphingobacterium multivorum]
MRTGKLKKNLEELSDSDEPIKELLGKVPSIVVRWGNTFILIFFLSIAIISILIKYPESINTKARLVALNKPKPIIANFSGKLISFSVKEDDFVKKGDHIGYIESIANRDQVLSLYEYVDSVIQNLSAIQNRNLPALSFSGQYNELGELQEAFQVFTQNYMAYKNYIPGSLFDKQKVVLSSEVVSLNNSIKNIRKEKDLLDEDLRLANETFDATENLREKKVISNLEYRTEKSKMLNKKLSAQQIDASILSMQRELSNKQKEIISLENDISNQNFQFLSSLRTLKSQIEDWIRKFALVAPIDGKISYKDFIQVNQYIQVNQIVCYINPEESKYYAETFIPQSNFGKVEIGQKALLRFPSYPYQEFGAVVGKVDFISKIGVDSGYLSKIELPENLVTTYNKEINYKDGLVTNVEIVTKDMRLIERFYYNILKITNR